TAATCATDGTFEMDAPAQSGTLSVDDPKYATVLAGAFNPKATVIEPVIVVAPLRRVAGHVVDAARRALGGADVGIALPANFRANSNRILDSSKSSHWSAPPDVDGKFAFESAPTLTGAMLAARLEGYEARVEPISAAPAEDIEIVLVR